MARLHRFVDDLAAPEHRLVVCNRTEPEPVHRMLEGLFEGQPVAVSEATHDGAASDEVLLLEGSTVVARSPLAELERAILFVNSDLYVTGARELDELVWPDVLAALDDVPFSVRGYPDAHHEKLLLITVSRWLERIAAEYGAGRIRSSFQRLSRIDDERGTRAVYEALAETPVDVHVYGVPDWRPPHGFDVTTHAGRGGDFRESWFVVVTPPDPVEPDPAAAGDAVAPAVAAAPGVAESAAPAGGGVDDGGTAPRRGDGGTAPRRGDGDCAADPPGPTDGALPRYGALLAVRGTDRGPWRGFWTHRPHLVAAINRDVERRL